MNALEAYQRFPSKKKAKKLGKMIKREVLEKIRQAEFEFVYNRLFAQLNQE